ncbi:hemagglutinin repeat-containing protein [Arcobacter sp.]|uniref:hemagglutinin repeat-containing protein n=1 Tax=Arcobacter sp. TaxID=1872629 RepID=UPI003D1498B9
MQLAKQSLSIFVSFSLFLNQCLYAADLPIEVDKTAAAKYQATLDKAPNGVQIVNIVNPNSKGMSHNKFKEYNVNPTGLILNNSKAVVNTQLAGYISFNPNLTNNASVILNEVTGTNKSLLKGYSEVAGVKADVIVANPNGITVNGGGFINTNKATLTTGRPSFLNGFVNGFDITQGQILIEGNGLNTTNINKVELYSKALQVNAKFYANNLKVATGDNFVDLAGNVTSKGTVGSGVSIDSSLLGGIYANRIELISSDKGVGVNLPPEVFAQDSIVLNSAGDIVLGKVTDDEGNNISKVTANDITMSADKIENNREVTAKNTINVTANSVTNNGFFNSESDLTFNVNTLDNYATLFSGNDMYLYVKDTLYNHEFSNILAINNLIIGKDTQKTNLIINKKAKIETENGDMTIYANELQNITDTPLKEDVYVGSESLDTISALPIRWAVGELAKEGKLQTGISSVLGERVCVQGSSQECQETVDTIGGIYTPLVYSANKVFLGYVTECNVHDCFRIAKYGYEIKYANATDVATKLNTYVSKFGVGVETRPLIFFSSIDINTYPGFRYILPGNEVRRIATITTKDEKIDTIPNPATILSHGKMNLYVNSTRNYLSQIASNDTLNIEGNSLNNSGETLYRKSTLTGRYEYQSGGGGWHHSSYDWADLPSSTTYQTIGQKYSSISSAKDITGGLASVNNIDIKDKQAPLGSSGTTLKLDETLDSVKIDPDTGKVEIQLPKSEFGLYIYSKDQNYLIEKNPAFTSYKTFVSSDYMLGKLNYKPEKTIKRLGDGLYENKLVRDSVFTQSGKRYLASNITSDAQQFTYLMDNALALQKDLQLTPGISLSKEQIANLTKDIVWMEEKVVNGQTVLAPVVYLTNIDNKNASLILANGNIKLNTTNLVNAGTIQSGNNLIVNAQGDILNAGGNLLASNDLNLDATNITNLSSTMQGNSVNITSDKFTSDVATKDIIRNLDNGVEKNTLVSQASNIISNTNVNIQTKEDINLIGTNVKAKEDVNLKANGNVNIASKEVTNSFDNTTKTGYLKQSKTQQLSSNVEANNVNVNGNNITVQASNVTAENDINLNAKNDVNVTASNNSSYYDFKHELKGGFLGTSVAQQDMKYKESVVSSNLNAKNILINSDKDVTLEAAKLKANENIIVDAKEDINVVAKQYKEGELHYSSKSSFGGLISSASMDQKESLKLNSAELEAVGKNIVFKSGDSVKVIASKLSAQNGGISIDAAKDILLSAGKEQNFEEKWSKKSSLFQGGEIISSKFDLKGKGSTTGLSTELNSKDLTLNSGNDTTVLGSDLNTSGNTAITTGGEFSQASIEEVFYQYEEHKKTSLKFNLKAAQQFAKDLFNQMKKNHTLKGLVQSNKDAFGTIDPGISIIGGNTSINLFEAQLQKSASNNKDTIQKSSNINSGGTVDINSNKGINVASSNINANGDINLKANDDINIHTLNNQNETSDKSLNLDTFIGLRSSGIDFEANYNKSDFSKFSTTAQGSEVNTNSNLNIDANNTLVEGSNINVGKNLTVNVQNDFNVIASTNSTGTSSYTFDAKSQSDDESKMKIKDAKIVMDMGEATVDKVKKTIDKTTKTSSNINVGENINVNSGNDILVEGSNLKANEDINLTASNNVDIKEAKESTYTNSEEFHGKAAVSVEVKHQAIEIVKAVKALNDAKKKAKQAKNDYKQYKSDLANLEQQLSTLTTEYDNKTPGITKADLEELKSIIQDVRSDESWYKKSIVLAEANLAMQSLFLAQQIMGLSKSLSSYAWGFDAGINLNIDTILQKANAYATSSVGSNINANNINLTANNQANVQGSNLYANNDINVNANEVNLLASSDKSSQEQKNEHANFNYNYSLFAGSTYTASYDRAKFDEATTTFTNSNVSGNNINITSTEDTNVKGANVNAQNKVDLNVGKDLNVVSVQNRQRSDSKSLGLNFSYSRSQDGNSSGSSGFTTGKSKSNQKQTVVTSITGKEVNVDVNNETYLQGSTIASIDENGNDNNNLNLKTNTLKYDDLSNTSYASNKSMGASISWSTKDNSTSLNKTSIQYSNNLSLSKDKTLSTVGKGNLEVANVDESSDLERLNRDVNNTTKEIYDVKRQMGNVDVTIDMRVFTKKGQEEIKNDFKEVLNNIDDFSRYVKDKTGNYKLSDEQKQTIKDKGIKESLIETLQKNNISDEQISQILADKSIQNVLNGISEQIPNPEIKTGTVVITLSKEEIIKNRLVDYIVDGAKGINKLVDIVGENNAAAAILILQVGMEGPVKTATNLLGDEVKDKIFGGVKSEFSKYIANDVFGANSGEWNSEQQQALNSLADGTSEFSIDLFLSGGVFGTIKSAKNLGTKSDAFDSLWKPASQISSKEANTLLDNTLPSNIKVDKISSSNTLNEKIISEKPKYQAPYVPDTKIVDFTTTTETQWVRVYKNGTESKLEGNWVMKKEDIEGLSAQQIAQKYSLPQVPDMITDVTVPAGNKMQASIANNIFEGEVNGGGGVQFEIKLPNNVKPPKTWFPSPPRPLN